MAVKRGFGRERGGVGGVSPPDMNTIPQIHTLEYTRKGGVGGVSPLDSNTLNIYSNVLGKGGLGGSPPQIQIPQIYILKKLRFTHLQQGVWGAVRPLVRSLLPLITRPPTRGLL